MSVATAAPPATPPARSKAARTRWSQRLSANVSSAGLNVAVLALTLAWIVPTLGLLINSFRPGGAFNTSGWWTALAPPFNFTLDSYRAVLGASDLAPSFFNSFMITIPATIIPTAVAAIASLVIFLLLWVWNDLLVALIYVGGTPEVAPLTVTLTNLVGGLGQHIEYLTAAAFVSMVVPLIVFFALQRYFVRGILAGSVKG